MDLQWLEHWHWWLLGVVLVILEVVAPGVFFLWIGLAAGVVGVLVWMQPGMFWEWQLLWFAALSIGFAVLGYQLFGRGRPTDQPALNRRGEQYVGRVFTLDEPINNGVGKVKVDDSTWRIRGVDCAAGSQVRVTGVDGVVLLVELDRA